MALIGESGIDAGVAERAPGAQESACPRDLEEHLVSVRSHSQLLREGAERVTPIANDTVRKVKQAMGVFT